MNSEDQAVLDRLTRIEAKLDSLSEQSGKETIRAEKELERLDKEIEALQKGQQRLLLIVVALGAGTPIATAIGGMIT